MGGQSTRWKGKRPRHGSTSSWLRSALLVTTVSLGGIVFSAACSGEDQLRPPSSSGGTTGAGASTGSSGGTCTEGEQRDCSVTISSHDGVLTCMDGTQVCEGGAWTACTGETMRTRPAPRVAQAQGEGEGEGEKGKRRTAFSVSTPTDCIDNPCDPSCQVFEEDPPGDVTIPPVLPPFPWNVGDINGLPPSVAQEGTHEPCTTAEDCQFDQFCDNPSGLACSHHPCATGTSNSYTVINTGLSSTCSPCVQKICAQDPSCCLENYTGSCGHNPCLTGGALDKACEGAAGCVNQICTARRGCCEYNCTTSGGNAFCATYVGAGSMCSPGTGLCSCDNMAGIVCPASALCSTGLCKPQWDNNCRNLVTTTCGKSCTPNPWDADCVAMVESECGADCETPPGTCEHDPCYTGDRLTSGCDPCVTAICAAKPACCTAAGRWDDSCVDLVPIHCAPKVCPSKGQCTAWLPGNSNPSCAGVDLTLGVPCGGTVPVCNRGSSQVPAGTAINIASWAPGSGHIPSSSPNEVLNSCNPPAGTLACSHTLTQPLDAGDCVSVTGCNGLAVNSEIMVNPAGANHVNECFCENNWSLYRNDACTSPACVASASVSYVKKATMFVAVDASTSMYCSGNGCPSSAGVCSGTQQNVSAQRWNPLMNALKTFFQDPASAGLDVALRFWPDDTPAPCNYNTCGNLGAANGCAQPRVPLGTLTVATGAADAQETALVNVLNNKKPCGDTPVHNALDGATYWAIQHKLANPEEEVMVVFITDGMPTHCPDGAAIKAVAQNAYYNHNVRTHVMGFGDTKDAFMVEVGQAGGGRSFYLSTGITMAQQAAFQSSIVAAMKAIRGDVLPCDIAVPVDGVSDPSTVTVVYTDSMDVDHTLTHVSDPASCVANGWYVDPVDPTKAKLCPQTCQVVQADEGARVQATVPCTTTVDPQVYTQTYEAECPQGSKVQWGLLRWNATTPSDSSVSLSVRTAESLAGLSSAMPHSVGVIQAAPTNTQVCDNSGPGPLCPVDLYTVLNGLPDARHDFLELTMGLQPAADQITSPTVHDWEITYSCPYSE